jgi:hypothetical protein
VATEISTWFSPIGAVGSGFTPGDPVVEVGPNSSLIHSLYLWVRNNGAVTSLAYDLHAATPGVIEFMGAEVFNPDLIDGGVDVDDRWNLPLQHGTISGDAQQITSIAAVAVNTAGLRPATLQFDTLYDSAADAAIFARVDYRAIGIGSTGLVLEEDKPGVIIDIPPARNFGSATIHVLIPEPASGLLLVAGLIGCCIQFRRRVPPR